ncbi:MAG: peptidoglycan DD-metalloendopeptidase family protein [Fimbriimonadales bacterium]|nr:peptidoglycan DD-metalloendopeptidase family protein [Fimbriimonadales bacterium]
MRICTAMGVRLGFWAWLATIGIAFGQVASERVGVTSAGHNLAVRPAPCSTGSLGTVQAGMDGVGLGAREACNGLNWLSVRWSNGLQGWSATGMGGTDYLAPLAGQGVFPNVAAPLAYPVRVGPNASALNVRTGPGTEHAILTSKAAGATGWAFEAYNNTATNTVWWKIRWDDGVVGWSAEAVRGAGIYLSLTGAPQLKLRVDLQALGAAGVAVSVSPTDMNHGTTEVNAPATLVYLAGQTVTLTAPDVAPNGATFSRWIVNGEPVMRRALTLRQAQSYRITLVYSPAIPASEDEFLRSLLAPWRQGQVWLPSTYDSHAGGNPQFAVDFNRLSSARSSCPYHNGFLQDCNEPMLASHAGRVYTRAQSGCTGYGNYAVVVSNVRQPGSSNTYLATIYAHLNYFLAPNGAIVDAGAPIGRLGSTGSSSGPHLHYEVRYVTVSGGTLTLGTRLQVLNNPRIRLSGQPLQVDLNCSISGLGYGGPAITGTAPLSSLPPNIEPSCTPYNCSGGLTDGGELPDFEPSRCIGALPDTLTLYFADVNGDSCVDDADLLSVLLRFGEACDTGEDINWDGIVDDADLLQVLLDFGRGCEQADR